MKYIEYGTEFLDQLKDRVHDLYDENKELKQEIERLKEMKLHTEKYASEMEDKYILVKSKNDKAIEYIENCHGMYRNTIGDIQPMINIKPVLDILKEGEKE